MSHVILAQLLAARAQIDATIALVEATVRPTGLTVDPEAGCRHPDARQRDASTFGAPGTVECLDCGWKRPGLVP